MNDIKEHPLLHQHKQNQTANLTPTEHICKKIADGIGSPIALFLAIAIQIIWIPIGIITKRDPYPFPFLLTCSNILQLILIFVLAVGQRQAANHAESRSEQDHVAISRLLYHQELQEELLLALAIKNQIHVDELLLRVEKLKK